MYLPKPFEETRSSALYELIRAHPLGTLVTTGQTGLEANHIPFELDPLPAPFGTLRGHIARGNPLWRAGAADALVIFQGPSGYVSPSWYPSKQETARVVPTWNYSVVHAHGALQFITDPAWLRSLVTRLTDRHEANRPEPWQVTDAPEEFVDQLLGAIVGVEVRVTRLEGKWKMSQNRPTRDRDGVEQGLRREGDQAALALADLVRDCALPESPS